MRIKSIRNMKIKTKLLIMGSVCILGSVCMGAESAVTSSEMNQISKRISDFCIPSVIFAEELNTMTSDYRVLVYDHVVTRDDEMNQIESELKVMQQEIKGMFAEYETYISNEIDAGMMEEARTYWDKYLEYSEAILLTSRLNDTETARKLILGDAKTYFEKASELFLKVVDFKKEEANRITDYADTLYKDVMRKKTVIILITILVCAVLVYYIVRSIDQSIQDIVDGTNRVSNGDLNVVLDNPSEDEIGVVTHSVNDLIARLKNIISDEKFMLHEIGNENYDVKSSCQQAYRGDFAPLLYAFDGLKNRLAEAEMQKEELISLRKQLGKQEKEANCTKIERVEIDPKLAVPQKCPVYSKLNEMGGKQADGLQGTTGNEDDWEETLGTGWEEDDSDESF